MGNPISPSLSQGQLQTFATNFFSLAQQENSYLGSSAAVMYVPSNGKVYNMGRIGGLDLVEANVRNADLQIGDYDLDNRQLSWRLFTRTIQIDKKYDVQDLIADPTSSLMQELVKAKNRVIDRIIVDAAAGSVQTGSVDSASTTTSAASDGVLTVTATSGFTYAKVTEITENFINNQLQPEMFRGSIVALTGSEHTDLMNEVEFTSNDYISARPAETGMVQRAGMYELAMFAGSVNGGITVSNPILTESGGTRNCLVLAPNSIAMAMEIMRFDVVPAADKVNSNNITLALKIGAMRTEGARVQIVTTTV